MSREEIIIPAGERGEVCRTVGAGEFREIIVVAAGDVRVDVVLEGEGAECEVYVLWTGCEVVTRVSHKSPNCRSYQLVKGLGSGRFEGHILVAEGARGTVALQQSRNILLREGDRIAAEPNLEIYADDVKCSHGATVGQLDEGAIFYMRQRGLDVAQARHLQLLGFSEEILGRISDERIRSMAAKVLPLQES